MINIPRGLIKHGIIYYLGAMASFVLMMKITLPVYLLLMVIFLIAAGYGAYLNYFVDRKVWAIILGVMALFFIPCLQSGYARHAAWKMYHLIAGFIFTFFLVVTVTRIIKKAKG